MDRYLAKKVIWWSNTQFITQTDEIVLKCHYFLSSLKIAIDSNLCNPATLIYLNVQDLCVLATLLVLHSLTKACCGWSCIQGSKVNPKSSSKDRSFQALNTRRVTLIADLYGRGESRCCNFNLLETGYKREALQLFFFCFSCKGKCFFFKIGTKFIQHFFRASHSQIGEYFLEIIVLLKDFAKSYWQTCFTPATAKSIDP